MRRAYKAILHGDRVAWLDGAPDTDGPVPVYVTVSDVMVSDDSPIEAKSTFDLLQALADIGAFAEIEDPVAWQREIRKDRPLPSRDDDSD